MQVSNKLVEFIQNYESFSATPYAATKSEQERGIYTIGYGMTMWPNGRRVMKTDAPITKEAASSYLCDRIAAIVKAANEILTVKLKQNEFDAVVMWLYNCFGPGYASRVRAKETTLIQRLNAGDKEGAAAEFDRWVYQAGQKLPGLVARREDEKELFLFADYQRHYKPKGKKEESKQK